jgi:hypothetical protein
MRIMDISELEIPEVPIPARILEEKARARRNQRAVISAAKARRRKTTAVKAIKRKAS